MLQRLGVRPSMLMEKEIQARMVVVVLDSIEEPFGKLIAASGIRGRQFS